MAQGWGVNTALTFSRKADVFKGVAFPAAILILANWPFTLSLSKDDKAVKRLRQAQPERYLIRQPSHTENC